MSRQRRSPAAIKAVLFDLFETGTLSFADALMEIDLLKLVAAG